jgi:secreted trypsin-like serine protease
MISPQLIDTLDRLPSALQTEVLHYAQYLATQHLQSSAPEQQPTKYRQAGTLQGMFTMADDFDAPLEDLKDYM